MDLLVANIGLSCKIENPKWKLYCAIPFREFEKNWGASWRKLYEQVLFSADARRYFSPSFCYSAYHKRNRWMVEHASRVIGVYHSGQGGTYQTLKYAKMLGKDLRIIAG